MVNTYHDDSIRVDLQRVSWFSIDDDSFFAQGSVVLALMLVKRRYEPAWALHCIQLSQPSTFIISQPKLTSSCIRTQGFRDFRADSERECDPCPNQCNHNSTTRILHPMMPSSKQNENSERGVRRNRVQFSPEIKMSREGAYRLAFNIENWKPTEDDWKKALSLIEAPEANRVGRFVIENEP